MEIDKHTGLVLEGGGMRGVFTCGVLDWLLDHHIDFPYTVAVSAGACNGLSYMSRQRGRAKYSNIDMLKKYKYIGMRFLWTQHSILNQELLYKDFPERIVPYDFEAYRANPGVFEMVTERELQPVDTDSQGFKQFALRLSGCRRRPRADARRRYRGLHTGGAGDVARL